MGDKNKDFFHLLCVSCNVFSNTLTGRFKPFLVFKSPFSGLGQFFHVRFICLKRHNVVFLHQNKSFTCFNSFTRFTFHGKSVTAAIDTLGPVGLKWDYVTSSCPECTEIFSREGPGQATKVIWACTRPAGCAVSVAGMPFSQLQGNEW